MGARGVRGQAFSVDLLIGVLVFLVAVGIIYSLLNSRSSQDVAPLRIESEVIAERLTGSAANLQVAKQNQLDMASLVELAKNAEQNYTTLKEQFGIRDEFCIYVQDEAGNLIYIQDASGTKYTGIGSGSGEINLTRWNVSCGRPCGPGQCG